MRQPTPLGEYLRARRALVHHDEVGLPSVGRRRVPGLRREELAALTGISTEYYLRLEQGRDQHPSHHVIEALARALRLGTEGTAHLHALAEPRAPVRRIEQAEEAPPFVEQLIASWPSTPAVVFGRCLDVLTANALATELFPFFRRGVNFARAVFLAPEIRRLVDEWDVLANRAVARLRERTGMNVEDARLDALISELSSASERFRDLWVRYDVELGANPTRTFRHPVVGRVDLQAVILAITQTDGQQLVAFQVAPGSASERALGRLATGAAGAVAAST